MRPKGKLFALLAVFMAIGVVAATGAFTTVSAERTATANVAGDDAALLQLDAHTGANGNTYADNTGETLQIDLTGDQSANGINQDARTNIQNVFVITNNGAESVNVNISDAGANDRLVTFYNGTVNSGSLEVDEGGSTTSLSPGNSVVVSIEINTTNAGLSSNDELIGNFTVYANAN